VVPSPFLISVDAGMSREAALAVLRRTQEAIGPELMLEALADALLELAQIRAIAGGR
jgi:hypothetical protein